MNKVSFYFILFFSISLFADEDQTINLIIENCKSCHNLNIDITKKGINFFERRFDDPKFFIWSNDFSGLKENFPSDKYVFVNNKTDTDDVYDLYLMTLCKNFIISPSTFSYWGAFLSNNKNKICLGPPNINNKSGYYGFSNNKDIRPDWWI